jgi:hypothetical protein
MNLKNTNLMNLNKKELIENIKQLEVIKDQTVFSKIRENIISYKAFILKMSLIALIIRLFTKFKVFRLIWKVVNLIILSIFGISLFDIYGIDYFESMLDFLRNSSIYKWIRILFKEDEVKFGTKSELKSINNSSARSETIEKLSQDQNKRMKWVEKTDEIPIRDEIPIYKNKYFIFGTCTFLILSGIIWWYFYPGDSDPGTIARNNEANENFRKKNKKKIILSQILFLHS